MSSDKIEAFKAAHPPADVAGGRRKGKPVPHEAADEEPEATGVTTVQQSLSANDVNKAIAAAAQGPAPNAVKLSEKDLEVGSKAIASTYQHAPQPDVHNKHPHDDKRNFHVNQPRGNNF